LSDRNESQHTQHSNNCNASKQHMGQAADGGAARDVRGVPRGGLRLRPGVYSGYYIDCGRRRSL
jgi:hypothetical protein